LGDAAGRQIVLPAAVDHPVYALRHLGAVRLGGAAEQHNRRTAGERLAVEQAEQTVEDTVVGSWPTGRSHRGVDPRLLRSRPIMLAVGKPVWRIEKAEADFRGVVWEQTEERLEDFRDTHYKLAQSLVNATLAAPTANAPVSG
jgi:hypothetical protein